jgi:hypothetical protein
MPMDGRNAHQTETFLLWVDAVGGFWVCLADSVTLGQPLRCGSVDVPILADISARHARIQREGEGYLIEAIREVRLDGRTVQGAALLKDRSRIELGPSVRLMFRRPHALSATARLDFLSHHHTQPSTDAVLLMAESCILGPGAHSHVVCRDWPHEVILYRQEGQLYCHAKRGVEIDGVAYEDRGPVQRDSHIAGEGFSLSLEPINV